MHSARLLLSWDTQRSLIYRFACLLHDDSERLQRMLWTRNRSVIATVAALLALGLAGCAGAGATPAATATTTQPPVATATVAPGTFAPTVDAASVSGVCAQAMMAPRPPIAKVGDLLIGGLNTSLQFPANQVPQSAGNSPIKLTASPTGMPVYGGTDGGGGYFSVCNASASQTITLQSVVVRI